MSHGHTTSERMEMNMVMVPMKKRRDVSLLIKRESEFEGKDNSILTLQGLSWQLLIVHVL